jgi:hypothetical protein
METMTLNQRAIKVHELELIVFGISTASIYYELQRSNRKGILDVGWRGVRLNTIEPRRRDEPRICLSEDDLPPYKGIFEVKFAVVERETDSRPTQEKEWGFEWQVNGESSKRNIQAKRKRVP